MINYKDKYIKYKIKYLNNQDFMLNGGIGNGGIGNGGIGNSGLLMSRGKNRVQLTDTEKDHINLAKLIITFDPRDTPNFDLSKLTADFFLVFDEKFDSIVKKNQIDNNPNYRLNLALKWSKTKLLENRQFVLHAIQKTAHIIMFISFPLYNLTDEELEVLYENLDSHQKSNFKIKFSEQCEDNNFIVPVSKQKYLSFTYINSHQLQRP
jgi:hypothetical protein